jgi:UDP-3-O-[3-hydroxymyristoyl] glucosamine N-acyltransferase
VVGSIGQSYERDDSGEFIKMPHVAGVILGDDVQIGVCASIVRGTLQDTVIGDGSAIGNQANVGHNVTIGAHCHIGAGAIVCGSSSLGDEVWLSIGAIIRSVSVGDGTMVGAAAVVTRPVPADSMANGFPARVTPKLNDYNQRTGR